MNTGAPMVSVCIITYNQEAFVEDAIKGALAQKTNFPFYITIFDDCSVDATSSVCMRYANQFPDCITYFKQEKNKGVVGNWKYAIGQSKGKYIALCEGDDYWTDPLKLQKQIDFLEKNPVFNLCGHRAVKQLDEKRTSEVLGISEKTEFEFDEIAGINLRIPTASVVFRNNIELPEWMNGVYGADRAVIFLNALKGKLKIMDFEGAVYRVHAQGVEQAYKKNKTALPLRSIKEDVVYLNLVQKKEHMQQLKTRIIKNYRYVLVWYILGLKPLQFIKTLGLFCRFFFINK